MRGHTWLARKFQASKCKWEVVEDHGPDYCPKFISQHITKDAAEVVALRLQMATGKKYKVIPK
jgi:hypothetical protein